MKPEGRRARFPLYSLAFAGLAAALIGVGVTGSFADVRNAAPSSSTTAAASAPPGLRLDATHTVGAPLIDENLAVFPIYASVQEDIGEFTTLDAAMERGTAV